jgi:hypothetical protein
MGYLEERLKMKNGLSVPKEKNRYEIPKFSKKKLQEKIDNASVSIAKSEWFLDKISKMQGRCVNCGEPINKNNTAFAIMSVAHVLPKRKNKFPSVALNNINWVELCVTKGCHDLYDRDWITASKMPFFSKAANIIKQLYPILTDEEKNRVPEFILSQY